MITIAFGLRAIQPALPGFVFVWIFCGIFPRPDVSESTYNQIVNGMSEAKVESLVGRRPTHRCKYSFNGMVVTRAEWADIDKDGDSITVVVEFGNKGKVQNKRRDIVTDLSLMDRFQVILSRFQ
jgi:hypothetical protein